MAHAGRRATTSARPLPRLLRGWLAVETADARWWLRWHTEHRAAQHNWQDCWLSRIPRIRLQAFASCGASQSWPSTLCSRSKLLPAFMAAVCSTSTSSRASWILCTEPTMEHDRCTRCGSRLLQPACGGSLDPQRGRSTSDAGQHVRADQLHSWLHVQKGERRQPPRLALVRPAPKIAIFSKIAIFRRLIEK